jgi:hypothetical protein
MLIKSRTQSDVLGELESVNGYKVLRMLDQMSSRLSFERAFSSMKM